MIGEIAEGHGGLGSPLALAGPMVVAMMAVVVRLRKR